MWWNHGPVWERKASQAVQARLDGGSVAADAAGVGAGSLTLPSNGGGSRFSTSFFCKATDTEEFTATLEAKYGTITRAWRVGLDQDDSGVLDFREFVRATGAIGYVGPLRTLWRNLDVDGSGSISLRELDAAAAAALEKFRVMCTSRCGSMQAAWDQLIDVDRSGTCNAEEFLAAAPKLGYQDAEEVDYLYSLLSVQVGRSFLLAKDLEFLQRWEEGKRAAVSRKRQGTGWINGNPNSIVLLTARSSASTSASALASDEPDYSTMVGGPDDQKLQEDFKSFLCKRFGSLPKAFAAMDCNGSGSLSLVEFQAMASSVLGYCRLSEASRLFLAFNKDPGSVLTYDELGIPETEWVMFKLEQRRDKRRKEVEAEANRTAALGSSPRFRRARDSHHERIRAGPLPRADVAFGMPLPLGWGTPPSFQPKINTIASAGRTTLSMNKGSLSAR